jgi:N-acetyl-alpha-D-muramate 1-phosphate uridylyltransferase
MRAMILAAGRGDRMRPLTDRTPKPLLEVGGKPIIQYHIEKLAAAGFDQIVINLAWKGTMLRERLGDGSQFGVRIQYSDEGEQALETGGGIFRVLNFLGPEPFVVVSGDIWSDFDYASLRSRPGAQDVAHFVLAPNPEFHRRGDFGLQGERLVDSGSERYTYANIGVIRPELFAGCSDGRFPLAPLMFEWIRRGRVSGELFLGRWRNIGTPAQLDELDRELRAP